MIADNEFDDFDISKLSREELIDLGFDPDTVLSQIQDVEEELLSPEELNSIKDEVYELNPINESSSSISFNKDELKQTFKSNIKQLKENLIEFNSSFDFNHINNIESEYNSGVNINNIIKKRFKRKRTTPLTEKQKKAYKRIINLMMGLWRYIKNWKEPIPGVTVNSVYVKDLKYGLYHRRFKCYTRPRITLYKTSEIPDDTIDITENNELYKPLILDPIIKTINEKDVYISLDKNTKINLKERKAEVMKSFLYKLKSLNARYKDVDQYQAVIEKNILHPAWADGSEAINFDASRFLKKNYKEFEKTSKKHIKFLFIRILLKRRKHVKGEHYDRHKKYKTTGSIKKVNLDKDELIRVFHELKNGFKTAEYFGVNYNTFKKYAHRYGVDTSQYHREYLEKSKSGEVPYHMPHVKSYIMRVIIKKFNVFKLDVPPEIKSKLMSVNPHYYIMKPWICGRKKKIIVENNIKNLLYNGPFIYNFNIKDTKIYELKEYLINNKIKENKCEICGRLNTDDNPLFVKLIDGNLNNISVDNMQITCYHCFINKWLFP